VAPARRGPTCRQDPEIFVFSFGLEITVFSVSSKKKSSLKINQIIWFAIIIIIIKLEEGRTKYQGPQQMSLLVRFFPCESCWPTNLLHSWPQVPAGALPSFHLLLYLVRVMCQLS
jgi:hypothetical protein